MADRNSGAEGRDDPALETGRAERGMEGGSRESSRAETQGDGDKRGLADDRLAAGRQGAQELPESEAHKLNQGDKLDRIIPRGTDEESEDR